uniref:Uncharacterized protein n=1 Tax=viral metagenome TaxID=1070528 RepID=A0A6C0JTQ8_9ZZZZ
MIESTKYDSCLDVSSSDRKISDFMDLSETEKEELFIDKEWKKYWINMPEFVQEDKPPHRRIILNFRSEDDYQNFAKLIEQNLTEKTKSIWYPKLEKDDNFLKRWIEVEE